MLNFSNLIAIFTFLTIFMVFVSIRKTKCTITESIGIKYMHVRESILSPAPKVPGFYIQASIISGVSSCIREDICCNWLQGRFSCNIVTYFSKQCSKLSHEPHYGGKLEIHACIFISVLLIILSVAYKEELFTIIQSYI